LLSSRAGQENQNKEKQTTKTYSGRRGIGPDHPRSRMENSTCGVSFRLVVLSSFVRII